MTITKSTFPLTKSKWFKPVWIILAALVVLLVLVLVARWLRELPAVKSFTTDYPGRSELPEAAPTGLPGWLGWQHFLNGFFIVLIIRSGWQVRTTACPEGNWTRNNKGLLRTKNPPTKISLSLWFHLSLDVLWVLNGIIFGSPVMNVDGFLCDTGGSGLSVRK